MKAGFVCALLLAVALCACASQVRYTQEEIQSYPLDIQQSIIKGEIAPGMTHEQVRYTWGPPDMVRKLDKQDGKDRDEWIYTTMKIFKSTLIFMNGKLTYIISTEPFRLDPK
jgi:outer membrane protein assembly factor BamE (lipoprotein component of BamABCDE complex)